MTPVTKKMKLKLPPIVFLGLGLLSLWGLSNLAAPLLDRLQQFTRRTTGAAPIEERMSGGEKLLITADVTAEKQSGITAFAQQDYATATRGFESALSQRRNDPETLIYLNNARIGKERAFKIAVSVPIGSNLNVAQEILRGVAQAQDEINQTGGINGSGLQVKIINDENDPEIVKRVAADLVNDSQILAVVGHNASNASLAAAPIYQNGQLVMVTPTSSANALSGLGSYIFRTLPTARFLADPLAQYAVKTVHKSRVAVCYDSESPDNITFKDEFTAALVAKGGKLIEIDCDLAAPSLIPKVAIAQAISKGAEAVLLTPHIDRLERAMALAHSNQTKLVLFGNPTLYTIQTLQSGQSDVNGLTLPVVWHPQMQMAGTFAAQAAQRWGGKVNWRTAMAYDATRAIAEGLKQGNTRSALQSVLWSPGFSATGAGDSVKFLASGDRLSTPALVQVQPTITGYDFLPTNP